jgi:hypothetical protein
MDATALMGSLVDNALASGYFESVNGHEPLSAPGHGITAAVWVQDIRPVPSESGLAVVSIAVTFNIRIYSNAIQEPQDAIDPNLITAASALLSSYSAGFTLGGQVMEVDIFGVAGIQLSSIAGWVEQSGAVYRVMTITLPVIVTDLWTEAP